MAQWRAKWIGPMYDPRHDLGVFAFRNVVKLRAAPASLPIRISADNRYKLYMNGKMVAFGPQRGDARHWFYDHFDLAPHLVAGENHIVALVWNFGWMAPMAQHTVRTGFVFEGEGLDTPGTWEVARVEGWGFEMMHSLIENFYIDIGPGEVMHPNLLPSTQHPAPSALQWKKPHTISDAEDRGTLSGGRPWMMIPRTLPPMRYSHRAGRPAVKRGFVGDSVSPDFSLLGHKDVLDGPVGLQPGSKLLLDYGELLCAYPSLVLSGPLGAEVKVTYSEAMWRPDGSKGNRSEVAGKDMRGYQDKLILGPEPSVYEPLWWRTYRYLMVEVVSPSPTEAEELPPRESGQSVLHPESAIGDGESQISNLKSQMENDASAIRDPKSAIRDPVTLHSIEAIETGYPYAVQSSFEADDPSVSGLWNVSVRTAERCAGETYFDCPYYEQLQYAGDTRIQTLIGYYLGRDRRLQRNAIDNLGWSLMENGLTQSRYPSRQTQVIPPFSLWWVMMLYDQMLYDSDEGRPDFVSPQTLARVIGRYRKLSREEGQFWQFGDWVPSWRWGVPPGGAESAMHQLTLMHASAAAASLKAHSEGKPHYPVKFERWQDFEPGFGQSQPDFGEPHSDWLIASQRPYIDCTPSEHGEALFRLLPQYHLEPEVGVFVRLGRWPTDALIKAKAAKCTYYFSYYKHLAMFGREDAPFDYMEELKPWKEMIENGLSTFAENPEPTRSDCHAWSAHPVLGFFQIVAGVTSIAPAWKKARIAPRPGSLKRFDAHIAHPDGDLHVAFDNGKLTVDTPVPAQLVWKGKKDELKAGKHTFPG